MKILAIGDFHGKFPEKLQKLADKVDLVVSVGDFCPFSLRKEFFKYSYRKNIEVWEVIGKNKMKKETKKDLKAGEKILQQLNKLKTKVITVTGNLDYGKWPDAYDYKPKWKWPKQDFFTPIVKKYKNIKCFDYSFVKFNNLIFIGMARSTFPGYVKSKNYKKQRKVLENLFKRFKKEKIIFVTHNVPYKTKLDKIKSKEISKKQKRKHYGSKLVKRIIEKYQPVLNICGHMHENQGKDKIKKTLIVNAGAAQDGKAAMIDIDKKIKVKFIK